MNLIKDNAIEPLILNRKQAILRSGSKTIFTLVTDMYNLTPFHKSHKMTLYWREDLDRALLFYKNRISIPSAIPSLSGR
jgi:hypothetical protein